MNETTALTILSATPYLGPVKIRQLVMYFGSAINVLDSDTVELAKVPGLKPQTLNDWGWWKRDHSWQKNLDLADQYGAKLIPFTSPLYPKRLLEVSDYPILLYVIGDIKESDAQSLAMIGTRNASLYGKEMAEKISFDLAKVGVTIVSGLARGIDTVSHRGALKGGRTIAVIGSGFQHIYPTENIQLAKEISQNGALISEYPLTTVPERKNFPRRNRIVSGMTLGTVLIEAPLKSGAMITMDLAEKQGRKLFALPGRADSEYFQGNHRLIKEGKAALIENASDICRVAFKGVTISSLEEKTFLQIPALNKDEVALLGQLPTEELTIEEILNRTKLPVNKINILLMGLVLKKVIREYPGKIYKKT